MKKRPPQWLRLDEIENAIDYIEKSTNFINSVLEKPIDWKWVCISLDTAFYLFIICCLGTNVMKPKNKKYSKMTEDDAYKANGLRLIGYQDAIRSFQLTHNIKFTSNQTSAISKYHDVFRNTFIHYKPSGWRNFSASLTSSRLHCNFRKGLASHLPGNISPLAGLSKVLFSLV